MTAPDSTVELATVELGPVTLGEQQTWAVRCRTCQTRWGGLKSELMAGLVKEGHDTAALRHRNPP